MPTVTDLSGGAANEAARKASGDFEEEILQNVKRYCYVVFYRAQLAKQLHTSEWDRDKLYSKIDFDHDGRVSLANVRKGFARFFHIHLTPSQLEMFQKSPAKEVNRETFAKGVEEVLRTTNYVGEHKDRKYTDEPATATMSNEKLYI
jgi:hypothetical protein